MTITINNTEIEMPSTASGLIRMALADVRKCEQDRRYTVNMSLWHSPNGKDECFVCLAGAMIAQTLQTPIHENVSPLSFARPICARLMALNSFRQGYICTAFEHLEIVGAPPFACVNIEPYVWNDGEPFHRDMNWLADELEKAGF